MKKYQVEITVFPEKKVMNIMKEHGKILSMSGGFPISPLYITWEGKEEIVPEIRNFAEVKLAI